MELNTWPAGDSDLAHRIRAFDWGQTPLGPSQSWPAPLRVVIDVVLRSPLPMIVLWGGSGVMIYNDAFIEIAGRKHPQTLGMSVLEGWPEVHDFNSNVLKVVLAGQTLSFHDQQLVLYRNEGPEHVCMDLYYTPVIGDSGNPEGVVSVVIETTQRALAERQREQAEAALLESNKQLRRANTDLEQFAYSASHDLQEPLRTVVIYSQLLKRKYGGKLDAQADVIIDNCVQGGLKMSELISDLLEYTMAAEHSIPVSDAVNLAEPLKHAIASLKTAIEEANAVVTYGELPSLIVNPLHFRQVLQNLIGNAIKYRSERPVSIHVSAEKVNGDWVITVADNGIGIEPSYQEQVFGLFKRLHGPGQYPGTGVGLALCKKWIERYGGRIWVESEFGQGSRFRFSLPASG